MQGASIPSSDNGNECLKLICSDGNTVSVLVGSSGRRKDKSEEEITRTLNSRENQINQQTSIGQTLLQPLTKPKEGNVVSASFMVRELSMHISENPRNGTNSRDQLDMDKLSVKSSQVKLNETKQSAYGKTVQKRKRGRTPKRFIKLPQSPVTGNGQGEDVACNGMTASSIIPDPVDSHIHAVVMSRTEVSLPNQESMGLSEDDAKLIKGQLQPKDRIGIILESFDKEVDKYSINTNERHSSRRSTMLIADTASRRKNTELNCIMKGVEKVIAEAPDNKFDDEPLSKWILEMHSPATSDASRVSSAWTMEQCSETSKKQKRTSELTDRSEMRKGSGRNNSAFEDKDSIMPSEQQIVPFVKKNVLWETIESMEIFEKTPQKPHFQPLKHFKESLREGLAIGYMVTFSSLVEKVSGLRSDDPKSVMDDILETLADLETFGFEVGVVRNRVLDLIAIKDKREKLISQVEEVHSKITEQNLQKSKLVEEMDEINKQIIKLKEKLSLAESSRESQVQAIFSLQSILEEIKENVRKAESDFEDFASRPL